MLTRPYTCLVLQRTEGKSDSKRANLKNDFETFNITSRYLDDISNINDIFFDNMVSKIYPAELQLNKANASDTEVRKTTKIRKRYNQVPHLTQDTTWESNKNTINITNKSQEDSPFPAGDPKAAMNRRESMRNTRHK